MRNIFMNECALLAAALGSFASRRSPIPLRTNQLTDRPLDKAGDRFILSLASSVRVAPLGKQFQLDSKGPCRLPAHRHRGPTYVEKPHTRCTLSVSEK